MVDTEGMQIGQLATAADTTPRTVRHYHRLGLLAEPRRRGNGYREYTMSDVVRLMRIRWLAANGVPLGSVAVVLAHDATDVEGTDDTVADLRALIAALEAERAKLTHRLVKLSSMVDDVESGRPLSALPSNLAGLLVGAIESAPTPTVRAALERERDLLEVLAISGKAPEELLTFYAASIADDEQRSRYSELLAEWSNLEGKTLDSAEPEIGRLSQTLMAWFEEAEAFAAAASDTLQSSETGVPIPLEEIIPDPAQREVVSRVQRGLASKSSLAKGVS
ncbi:MAG: MerR family transcriptional regulator [Rhodococcus sp. (in: high G+C Gram-positive bacteria)]